MLLSFPVNFRSPKQHGTVPYSQSLWSCDQSASNFKAQCFLFIRTCEVLEFNGLKVSCHMHGSFQTAKRIPVNCHLVAGEKK